MSGFRLPWDDLPPARRRQPEAAGKTDEATEAAQPTARQKAGVRQARQRRIEAEATADPGTGWQWWHLVVHGPADAVAAFAKAARGPGVIPWRVDDNGFEDEVVAFAFGGIERPSLSVAECRILARQFREAIESRRARNHSRPDRATRCPLDLQALLPVPPGILRLGATHPDAEAWLNTHWGVGDQLRHAERLHGRTAGRRLPQGHVPLVYGFFTKGLAPEAARLALRERWPMLVFRLHQRPMT